MQERVGEGNVEDGVGGSWGTFHLTHYPETPIPRTTKDGYYNSFLGRTQRAKLGKNSKGETLMEIRAFKC